MMFQTQAALSQPSYLLHGSDTGKGTSRRCPVPHRSPRRWADTGLCCPIWACRPPPPSPSSPGRREKGCDHPALGLESWAKYTGPFCRLEAFTNWIARLPRGLPSRRFRECAQKLSRSLLLLWVLLHLYNLGRGAEIFPLTYGTAVISSSLQSGLY